MDRIATLASGCDSFPRLVLVLGAIVVVVTVVAIGPAIVLVLLL